MKYISFLVVSIFLSLQGFSQDRSTLQEVELYKDKGVKSRKKYSAKDSRLIDTDYYDLQGQLIKNEIVSDGGATNKTTHFIYDRNGKIIQIVDSVKTNLPVSIRVRRLQKYGLDPKRKRPKDADVPKIEVGKYELTYVEDELIKKIKYLQDGSIDKVEKYQYKGRIQDNEWYVDGEVVKRNSLKFIDNFHKDKDTGWAITNSGKEVTWDYKYVYEFKKGVVVKYTKYNGQVQKEIVEFLYNNDGLLVNVKGLNSIYFEYEYY